ncbi:spermidine synthase [Pseudoalteromonas sp. T1lg48]|uniref:spermidine synthase n=1 Tax=Pseudoalteromonas sp. T1lg48 TaxID=2077100 RepID=UPI000CF6E3FD|nr:fused MFS/spermidine synthase [Pseudoalteromonas sp. T1lg48]
MLAIILVFLSAFLLFQVQPIMAKMLLPSFGGGTQVWTACLLFFQTFLLASYGYAHLISSRLALKKQFFVHGGVLLAGAIALPIGTQALGVPSDAPALGVLAQLAMAVGLPYFALAATAPLMQSWQAKVDYEHAYKLYSYSNIGSFLALLSYPFAVEPWLGLGDQSWLWSGLFVAFAATFYAYMARFYNQAKRLGSTEQSAFRGGIHGKWLLWLLLSACGVMVLTASTNAMTQNVAPVPFLWLLPLALYLLTFVLCFHSPKAYHRIFWLAALAVCAFISCFLFFIGSQFDIVSQVILYSLVLFAACMICHGELVHAKPSTEYLTQFYLVMALGGALGTAVITFIAPQVFTLYYEYPLAIGAALILFAWGVVSDKGIRRAPLLGGSALGTVALAGLLFFWLDGQFKSNDIERLRNFYGLLTVTEVNIEGRTERRLIDGTTTHGVEVLKGEGQGKPQSYYRPETLVGHLLQNLPNGSHVGFIGLGAGTLAAYGKPGDHYRFYELNPNVLATALAQFSYLDNSQAKLDYVLGDGRITLSAQQAQGQEQVFNALVLDAFSGDAIPMHLLTQEAMALYLTQLKEDGILAVHISNTHLDLTPLMRGLAQQFDLTILYGEAKAEHSHGHDVRWVLLSRDKAPLEPYRASESPWPSHTAPFVWRDDYSNLLQAMKFMGE